MEVTITLNNVSEKDLNDGKLILNGEELSYVIRGNNAENAMLALADELSDLELAFNTHHDATRLLRLIGYSDIKQFLSYNKLYRIKDVETICNICTEDIKPILIQTLLDCLTGLKKNDLKSLYEQFAVHLASKGYRDSVPDGGVPSLGTDNEYDREQAVFLTAANNLPNHSCDNLQEDYREEILSKFSDNAILQYLAEDPVRIIYKLLVDQGIASTLIYIANGLEWIDENICADDLTDLFHKIPQDELISAIKTEMGAKNTEFTEEMIYAEAVSPGSMLEYMIAEDKIDLRSADEDEMLYLLKKFAEADLYEIVDGRKDNEAHALAKSLLTLINEDTICEIMGTELKKILEFAFNNEHKEVYRVTQTINDVMTELDLEYDIDAMEDLTSGLDQDGFAKLIKKRFYESDITEALWAEDMICIDTIVDKADLIDASIGYEDVYKEVILPALNATTILGALELEDIEDYAGETIRNLFMEDVCSDFDEGWKSAEEILNNFEISPSTFLANLTIHVLEHKSNITEFVDNIETTMDDILEELPKERLQLALFNNIKNN